MAFIDPRAIRAAEVFDPPTSIPWHQPGVLARYGIVVGHDIVGRFAAYARPPIKREYVTGRELRPRRIDDFEPGGSGARESRSRREANVAPDSAHRLGDKEIEHNKNGKAKKQDGGVVQRYSPGRFSGLETKEMHPNLDNVSRHETVLTL